MVLNRLHVQGCKSVIIFILTCSCTFLAGRATCGISLVITLVPAERLHLTLCIANYVRWMFLLVSSTHAMGFQEANGGDEI